MTEPEELPDSEYDGPWKDALEFGLELFLVEYHPTLFATLDWVKDWESLSQELQRLFPASEAGVRYADALFKLFKRSGDPLYLHIEIQAFFDALFGSRTMTYRHRLRDWLGVPVVTIAVLADKNENWYPYSHEEGQFGSGDSCTWWVVKLLRWAGLQEELESKENVFCLFVAAHLEALRTRKNLRERKAAKVRLLSNLQRRHLAAADGAEWYRLIDWLLRLPREVDREVHDEVRRLKGDESMRYVSFAEREGREDGRVEGRKEGRKEGRSEGIRATLRVMLRAKFGAGSETLADQLGEGIDENRLETLGGAVMKASSLDELRPLFGNGAAGQAKQE